MKRILVVDDDRAIRELLKFALEFEGYEVQTLSDGSELVQALACIVEPCLVLMDLMMPRMSGWDVCHTLATHPNLLGEHEIVIMTAAPISAAACPAPARHILRKPFDLEQLFRLVNGLLVPTTSTPPPHAAPLSLSY